jgi:hypothetical protein
MLTFEDAKKLLSTLTRQELRDHAFGDREIYWVQPGAPAGTPDVAFGYAGSGDPIVSISYEIEKKEHTISFHKEAALELMTLGAKVEIERNDETGPEEYQDGKVMSSFTLEGVLEELVRKGKS